MGMAEVYREHKAVGTSFVPFLSLNTFQKDQPRIFQITARGAPGRGWFAEFLTAVTSSLDLEKSSSWRSCWFEVLGV